MIYAGTLVAAALSLGGWLIAQGRDQKTGQPRLGTTRLGSALAALGLLVGILTLPTGLGPTTYAAALAGVLLVGLVLLRGAARQAVGWTALGEVVTTAVGLAWAAPRRAVWATLAVVAGIALAGVLVARGGPLAGVLGAALVLAPARWWLAAAWKRETTRTGIERALAGLLAGGSEWDRASADLRGAPVCVRFDADQNPARVRTVLPPAWSASKTEELEREVAARLGAFAPAWVTSPNPSKRTLTLTRGEVLPETCAYSAQDGDRRQVALGLAKVSRAAAKAGLGAFGSIFQLVWDLRVSPHGLIVGLTGSGKSAAAYVVLTTWCAKGNQVILCDPKRVECTPLRGRKGVLRVETELAGIVAALEQAQTAMEQRYAAMASTGARNVFKLSAGERPVPLLVFVDEVFELLAKRGGSDDETKEINGLKARAASIVSSIAALGRAADVHLLLACQRADRAVVEGALQNNLPTRVLAGAGAAKSTERHMVGLQEVDVLSSVPGRCVAQTIGVPECEMQAFWLDEDELDRWLPVVDEAAVVRPKPLTESERSKILIPAAEAAGPLVMPEPETEAEVLERVSDSAPDSKPNRASSPSENPTGPTPNSEIDPLDFFEG